MINKRKYKLPAAEYFTDMRQQKRYIPFNDKEYLVSREALALLVLDVLMIIDTANITLEEFLKRYADPDNELGTWHAHHGANQCRSWKSGVKFQYNDFYANNLFKAIANYTKLTNADKIIEVNTALFENLTNYRLGDAALITGKSTYTFTAEANVEDPNFRVRRSQWTNDLKLVFDGVGAKPEITVQENKDGTWTVIMSPTPNP